jgi:signal transduction histidine kinase
MGVRRGRDGGDQNRLTPRPAPSPSPWVDPPVAAALASGALLTLVVTISPLMQFAYDNVSLHVALETAEGLIGALLGYLAVQRFRARRSARDAVLAWTFAVLSLTNLVLSAVPMVTVGSRPEGALTWAVIGLRLFGAAGLCVASVIPERATVRASDLRRWVVRVSWGVAVVVAVGSAIAGTTLDHVVDPFLSPEASGRPRIVGHPAALTIQVLAMALYGSAAIGFVRQAGASGDELLRWLAGGAALAAFARLNYFLFPSLYSNWVYTGDVLRLGAYLWFLVGASREIDAYRQDQTRLAVVEERRRMARDLHDGLVQELSFIRSQTAAAAGGMEVPGMAEHLAAAADRALRESRRAVDALSGATPERLADALRIAADDVAARAGTAVSMVGRGPEEVRGEVRHALAQVVREATSNAVRHGKATSVVVRLDGAAGSVRVVVSDDGKGFDVEVGRTGGFGLRSMRERVENLGGSFAVRSEPGAGTEVEIVVPLR